MLVNAAGLVVWEAGYLPFGEARIVTAGIENNLRFPGQYYDAETGLHYNFHRYYNPATGRYITADHIGLEGGINLYAYVNGNPVNRVDPWGLYIGQLPPPPPGYNPDTWKVRLNPRVNGKYMILILGSVGSLIQKMKNTGVTGMILIKKGQRKDIQEILRKKGLTRRK